MANRREIIGDIDYIDQLSEKEKEWLNSFLSETIITNFKHRGKKLIKAVEKKRELYRENNKRNADLYNVVKNTGMLIFTGSNNKTSRDNSFYLEESHDADDMEDMFISAITIKEKLKGLDIEKMTDEELAELLENLK